MTNEIPNWAWDTYQALQADACHYGNIDELLTYLCEMFANGNVPNTQEELDRKIKNRLATLRRNRRNRLRITQKHMPELEALTSSHWLPVTTQVTIEEIKDRLPKEHWRLLVSAYSGDGYRSDADALNYSPSKARSIVYRTQAELAELYLAA